MRLTDDELGYLVFPRLTCPPPHPPVQAPRVDRPSRLHAGRVPAWRLPAGARAAARRV